MARGRKIHPILLICLIGFAGIAGLELMGYPAIDNIQGFIGSLVGDGDAFDGEYSRFTGSAVKKDAVATAITSEVMCAWLDWNGDGAFSFDEVEQMTTDGTTGVFTSSREYPIGVTIYLQLDDAGEAYQTEVKEVMMVGSKNSDGSAKQVGALQFMATDDGSLSYYGLVGGVALDDATDYNYTLNGANEEMVVFVQLATSDAGFTSQCHAKFGSSSFHSWLSEKEYAPTFLGGYMTNQDFIDAGMLVSEWDYVHVGATNTYFAKFVNNIGDGQGEFYDSDATNAPTWSYGFTLEITANCTFIYLGLFQDVELDDFNKDVWGPTTDATILGTLGADWDINNG